MMCIYEVLGHRNHPRLEKMFNILSRRGQQKWFSPKHFSENLSETQITTVKSVESVVPDFS